MDVADKMHGGAPQLLRCVAARGVVLGGLKHHDRLIVDARADLEEAEDVAAAVRQRRKVGVELGVARVAGLESRVGKARVDRPIDRSIDQSNTQTINQSIDGWVGCQGVNFKESGGRVKERERGEQASTKSYALSLDCSRLQHTYTRCLPRDPTPGS